MTWEKLISFSLEVALRYFIIAGLAFLIFYVLFSKKLGGRKIQSKKQKTSDYRRDIFYSIIAILIFGAQPVIFLENDAIRPYTTLYMDISEYGWVYFFLAFPIMFFLHDTYFYWTHRMMHHPKLFKWFHLIHHKTTNPSPWTAYAFHPLEALVESGIFILFIFLMPVHVLHLSVFFFLMFVYNVYGHLGYELYPSGLHKTKIGKWVNTSVAHNQHHQFFTGNYGLYFLFWDRWMGTLRPNYDEKFESRAVKHQDIVVTQTPEVTETVIAHEK